MINIDGQSYLDVREAAERLGVKPETLYAYVSRGMLQSYRQGIRRRRLYLLSEIDSLLRLRPGGSEASDDAGVPDATPIVPTPVVDLPISAAPAAHDSDLPPADRWAAER